MLASFPKNAPMVQLNGSIFTKCIAVSGPTLMGKCSHVPQAAPVPVLSANAVRLLSPSLWLPEQMAPVANSEEGLGVPSGFLFWTANVPRSWSIRTFTCRKPAAVKPYLFLEGQRANSWMVKGYFSNTDKHMVE